MGYERRSVDLSGYPDLVVIYLGYRAASLAGLRTMLRIGRGLEEIRTNPPDGLLSHEGCWFGVTQPGFRQYWRDFDSLEAFTGSARHREWWLDFARNPRAGGIWHETYRIGGGMEAIYSGMPPVGFGSFAPARAPEGRFMTARQRVASPA